jgi:hypothetical protein
MYDRLDGIKDACHAKVYGPAVSDVSWLIAEVERLRNNLPAVAGDLEEIFERSTDRDASTQRDIDWLIAQVAMLRKQLTHHEDLKRAADGAASKIAEIKAARIADLEILLGHAQRSMQALGGFDPSSPAHGALRLITQNIKYKLTAACYGAEGVVESSTEDRCDPTRSYHSTPHKGCILR